MEKYNNIINKTSKDYDKISKHFNQTRKKKNWLYFKVFNVYIKEIYSKNNHKLKILDAGCGNGRLIEYLNTLGIEYDYLGIDNSKHQIEVARENYKNKPNIKFEFGNILDIKNKKEEFDLIFCIAVFHHMPSQETREKVVNEFYRVLKMDGYLFMTNWNLFQKKYLKYIFTKDSRKNIPRDTFIPYKNNFGEVLSERYYYAFFKSEIKRFFRKKFNIIKNYNSNKCKKSLLLFSKNIITIMRKIN
ncbi:class I SAM-dependent methyltransferase [Patescibacteria group bacterium]|nr:class I SAM-dependent methyltransferase [Patescibacteria group bacterium]